MKGDRLSLSQKRALESWTKSLKKLPKELKALHISSLIKLYRKRLCMTQRQLAKRAGVTQPFIAKLERGSGEISTATLKKIFSALYCELIVVAMPLVDMDKIIEQQAEIRAKKKIRYLKGTMALEKQLPKRSMIKMLMNQEKAQLIDAQTSEIWD